ncbi:MAG: tRNA pseudouridine(13) synthase TruD [Phycisphaerales bacterium]|nr:MAG: tRNA pseudouridine(13) synthase TruD [Phycisphaerales bacterium]
MSEHRRVYLTGTIEGTGGRIKQRPEDFLVEEIPAYEACGSGEHVYLFVQKRGVTTLDAVRILAEHFGVSRGAVGYAGLKDARAVTRQVMSVHLPGFHGDVSERFGMIRDERVGVLWVDRHTNKIRPGHLRGNRFSIRIREVEVRSVLSAKRVLDILERVGVPNRFGTQRFGVRGNNHVLGRLLLKGDGEGFVREMMGVGAGGEATRGGPGFSAACERFGKGDMEGALAAMPEWARAERRVLREMARGKDGTRALRAIDRDTRAMYLSAVQGAVFNRVLETRLREGTLATMVAGDLAFKHDSGAVFGVDESLAADAATKERVARMEISPSGPMWGPRMMRAGDRVDAMEIRALEAEGLTLDDLGGERSGIAELMPGVRRPLRVAVVMPEVEGGVDEHGAYVRVAFELARGAYATEVLEEIMKVEVGEGSWDTGEVEGE